VVYSRPLDIGRSPYLKEGVPLSPLRLFGVSRSLAAHMLWEHDHTGSNPVAPTKNTLTFPPPPATLLSSPRPPPSLGGLLLPENKSRVGKFFDNTAREPADFQSLMIIRPCGQNGSYQYDVTGCNHIRVLGEPITTAPPNDAVDYTGTVFDRLTVVGYSHTHWKKGTKQPPRHHWFVRCSCGRIETRTNIALKRKKTGLKACAVCRANEQKKHSSLIKMGLRPPGGI
jgi:hypothetical protein